MSLADLASSKSLQAQWLEVLPHTTVIDCTSEDLRKGLRSPYDFAGGVQRAIAALESSTAGLLQTAREVMTWQHHQEALHKYVVVAPGNHVSSDAALQSLVENQELLYHNNILFCSPYCLIPPGGCPWATSNWENRVINKTFKEAIIRLHCPRCALPNNFTTQRLGEYP